MNPVLPVSPWTPNIVHQPRFWTEQECDEIENYCMTHVPWYIVKYKSKRFKKQCSTPCLTSFFCDQIHGGIPNIFKSLIIRRCEERLGHRPGTYFNAVIMRLYRDNKDNIAYHSDERCFLDQRYMDIASATFGPATREFCLLPTSDAWDPKATKYYDKVTKVTLNRGCFMAMRGVQTQQKFLHAVLPTGSKCSWRININLRRIRVDVPALTRKGIWTFYKYCVFGDDESIKTHTNTTNSVKSIERINTTYQLGYQAVHLKDQYCRKIETLIATCKNELEDVSQKSKKRKTSDDVDLVSISSKPKRQKINITNLKQTTLFNFATK